jgi:hypothetical protein
MDIVEDCIAFFFQRLEGENISILSHPLNPQPEGIDDGFQPFKEFLPPCRPLIEISRSKVDSF